MIHRSNSCSCFIEFVGRCKNKKNKKCSTSLAFYHSPSHLINSIKHDHSCTCVRSLIFQAYCKMLGAGLAEINSDAEEKLVEGFLQTLHGMTPFKPMYVEWTLISLSGAYCQF